jgi:hypothetical protein
MIEYNYGPAEPTTATMATATTVTFPVPTAFTTTDLWDPNAPKVAARHRRILRAALYSVVAVLCVLVAAFTDARFAVAFGCGIWMALIVAQAEGAIRRHARRVARRPNPQARVTLGAPSVTDS